MKKIKTGDKVKITGFLTFKDNLFRRLIGKLIPSFDRSGSKNGEYIITGTYTSEERNN